MSNAPESTAWFGRYPLWALMAAPIAAGLLLAIGKWLGIQREALDLVMAAPGTLPTEWALVLVLSVVAMMMAAAARTGSLRSLLRSRESPIWYGGVLMLAAGFFRVAYGPWGVGLGLYQIVTWNLSMSGLPMLLIAWPMAFGAIVASSSFLTTVTQNPPAFRGRWIVVGLFLAVTAGAQLAGLIFWSGAWREHSSWIFLGSAGLVLASIAITIGFARGDRRKAHLMALIGALWLLPAVDPTGTMSFNGQAMPLLDALRDLGPGHWLQALGTLLILAGSLVLLASSGDGRPSRGAVEFARDIDSQ